MIAVIPVKLVSLYVIAQASAIAATVVAVVHSTLSPFAQALILAVVTSIIGVLGVIIAALITTAATRHTDDAIRENTRHVEDVKHAVGADKRSGDTIDGER